MEDDLWGHRPEEWGKKPRHRPPQKWCPTQWDGSWERTIQFWRDPDTGVEMEQLGWSRNLLEMDGHEDCCRHSWPKFYPLGEPKPSTYWDDLED